MITTEGFVLGYSVSGPAAWKDKSGRTLEEIEAECFIIIMVKSGNEGMRSRAALSKFEI